MIAENYTTEIYFQTNLAYRLQTLSPIKEMQLTTDCLYEYGII